MVFVEVDTDGAAFGPVAFVLLQEEPSTTQATANVTASKKLVE